MTQNQLGLNQILNPFEAYTIPLDDWVTKLIDFLVENFRPLFQAIGWPISLILESIESALLSIPPLIFLLITGLVVWQFAGRKVASYSIIALTLIGFVGTWQEAMVSLSLVVTAVVFCLIAGIPLGIACAKNDAIERIIRPLLDVMQTVPTFCLFDSGGNAVWHWGSSGNDRHHCLCFAPFNSSD
jgi:ABC-type proline/glycine betaine transport system permease subunit